VIPHRSLGPGWSVSLAASALDQVNDGLIVVDGSWTVQYTNAIALALVERTHDEMVGQVFWDVFPEAYDHEFGIAYRQAMETGVEQHLEAYYGPLRGWFDVRAIPTADGLTFCFQNVNERREAAAAQDALVQAIMAVAESLTVEDVAAALDGAVLEVLGMDITDLSIFDEPREGGTSLTLTASSVTVPLVAAQHAVGAAVLAWDADRDVDEHVLRFLRMLGAQGGAAIERTRLLARQQIIAETLQQAMLPVTLPHVDGVDIAASYLPATAGLSVGGDWYDALALRDGRLVVAVGDVAGHGVDAAAAMGQVRNALRAYAVEGHGPAAMLQLLDELIDEAGHDLFTTAVVAEYQPSTGVLTWGSAGHLPPILWTSGGVRLLESEVGAPIGVRGPAGFTESEVKLEPGDVFLAYTDGLVERRGEDLGTGLERLCAAVERLPGSDPATVCDDIVDDVVGGARSDDICVLAIRRT
jgi:PAS domain-containing protein